MNKEFAKLCIRAYVEETWRSDGDTEVLLDTIEQRHCLAIRGTEFELNGWRAKVSWEDILSDARIVPWYDKRIGWGRKGFLRAAQGIWPHIEEFVMRKDTAIVIGGHSLGGSVACYAAGFMISLGKVPEMLITFGCPKPGFDGLIQLLSVIPYQRHFYNVEDMVVEVPPLGTSPVPRVNAGGIGHKMSEYAAGKGLSNDN